MANRIVTMDWSELDDILAAVGEAWDLVEAIHMAAESTQMDKNATGAIQRVASAAQRRLYGAQKSIEGYMGDTQ